MANDPTGFKTKLANEAKAAASLKTFRIPKRSPQLNVLDYAVCAEINKRMRRQERCLPCSRKEMRSAYLDRLRRTARRLPAKFIKAAIMSLKRHCEQLVMAKGGHIEEGGARGVTA